MATATIQELLLKFEEDVRGSMSEVGVMMRMVSAEYMLVKEKLEEAEMDSMMLRDKVEKGAGSIEKEVSER